MLSLHPPPILCISVVTGDVHFALHPKRINAKESAVRRLTDVGGTNLMEMTMIESGTGTFFITD